MENNKVETEDEQQLADKYDNWILIPNTRNY